MTEEGGFKVVLEYSFDNFLKGRENKEAYKTFFNRFLCRMERKAYLQTNFERATKDDDLTSVSNEAFCLLLLDNNWDRWIDVYEKSKGDVLVARKNKKPESVSSIPPKYTIGGINWRNEARGQTNTNSNTPEKRFKKG